MSVTDVDYAVFINALAQKLRSDGKLQQPEWTQVIKTGCCKQYQPDQQNWYFVKAAAILRQIYIRGPLGITDFRNLFGQEKQSTVVQSHFVRGAGKVCRVICQDLAKQGLITIQAGEGRVLTANGKKTLDTFAQQLLKK